MEREKSEEPLGIKGSKSNRTKSFALLAVVLLLSISLRLLWLHITVHTDEAEYGYTAMMWARHGYLPYVYRQDMQPPLVYFVYLVAGNLINVRLFNDTAFFVSVIVMFYLAKKLLGGLFEAVIASLMYAILMNIPALEGMFALPASMAIPFVVGSFYVGLAYWQSEREHLLILAGILTSIAGMFYLRELSFLLILIFIILQVAKSERKWAQTFKRTGLLLSGALLPFLPFAVYYTDFGRINALFQGVLSPLYYPRVINVVTNPLPWVLVFVVEILPFVILAVIGIVISVRRRLQYRTLLMLMLALNVIIDIFIFKFFGHYWLNAVTPSVLFGAVSISALVKAGPQSTKKNVRNLVSIARVLAISFLILVFLVSFYFQVQQYPTGSIQLGSFEMQYSPFGSYENQTKVATFLRDNVGENDQILVHGWMPEIYYLSGIEAPSPDLNTVDVGVTISDAEYQRLQNMVVQQEFKYIVLAHWDGWDTDSIATLTEAYYEKIDTIGYCELFQRQQLYPVLNNSGFEDSSSWVIGDSAVAAYNTAFAHSGNRSISITQSSNLQLYAVWQNVPAKGNTEYVLSAWGLNVPQNDIWFAIGETDSNGKLLQPFTNIFTNFFSTSEWSPTAYRFTTLNATASVIVCINVLNLGFNYTAYFDDVQLFSTQP
jgi:hypothetical protein